MVTRLSGKARGSTILAIAQVYPNRRPSDQTAVIERRLPDERDSEVGLKPPRGLKPALQIGRLFGFLLHGRVMRGPYIVN